MASLMCTGSEELPCSHGCLLVWRSIRACKGCPRVRDDFGRTEGLTPQLPLIAVIAYGSAQLLSECLRPLRGMRVIVLDNSANVDVRAVAMVEGARYVDTCGNMG